MLTRSALQTPPSGLGRLLAEEKSMSDLLAFLCELDPVPLVEVLELGAGPLQVIREHPLGSRLRGRLDLAVLDPAGRPVAALELKGAATVHGDQLIRYETWAARFSPRPKLFYYSLDRDQAVGDAWDCQHLTDLFAAWRKSAHHHARWLAAEALALLGAWDKEADRSIAACAGWYAHDIVTRRTAHALDGVLSRHGDGSEAMAMRTSGGQPMLMAWRRHPDESRDAWLAVDVRSPGRSRPCDPWLIRPCVDLYPAKTRDAVTVAVEAHDLACILAPAMTLPAVADALTTTGQARLTQALSAEPHGGLRGAPTPQALADRRTAIVSGETKIPSPVFYHDKLTRLATQFTLDVGAVTRADLASLVLVLLDHLVDAARRTSSGGSR